MEEINNKAIYLQYRHSESKETRFSGPHSMDELLNLDREIDFEETCSCGDEIYTQFFELIEWGACKCIKKQGCKYDDFSDQIHDKGCPFQLSEEIKQLTEEADWWQKQAEKISDICVSQTKEIEKLYKENLDK